MKTLKWLLTRAVLIKGGRAKSNFILLIFMTVAVSVCGAPQTFSADLAGLDPYIAKFLGGKPLTLDDLQQCVNLAKAFRDILFKEDQAAVIDDLSKVNKERDYVVCFKMAFLHPKLCGGWPDKHPCTKEVFPSLKERVRQTNDAILMAAVILPAILCHEEDYACSTYEQLSKTSPVLSDYIQRYVTKEPGHTPSGFIERLRQRSAERGQRSEESLYGAFSEMVRPTATRALQLGQISLTMAERMRARELFAKFTNDLQQVTLETGASSSVAKSLGLVTMNLIDAEAYARQSFRECAGRDLLVPLRRMIVESKDPLPKAAVPIPAIKNGETEDAVRWYTSLANEEKHLAASMLRVIGQYSEYSDAPKAFLQAAGAHSENSWGNP